jgi:hypothetical protein
VPSPDDPPLLSNAARQLRSIAERTPEIANDLRDMADDLDAKTMRSVSRLARFCPPYHSVVYIGD